MLHDAGPDAGRPVPQGAAVLGFGAQGEEVRRLQKALNLVPGGAPLAADGMFGPLTHKRVCGFQQQRGLVADGIVGPLTWGILKPFLDLLDKAAPAAEAILRERIRAEALAQQALLGWNHPMQAPPPGALNISLRRMADTATRARQGGPGLLTVLHGGGAHANYQSRALTIPAGMAAGELDAADPVNDEREYSRRRNSDDILSWCGVFALHVLRRSGVSVLGWAESGGLTSQVPKPGDPPGTHRALRVVAPVEVGIGDVGVMSPAGRNHHFVVVGRTGGTLDTVDGNAGFHHSIVRTSYTLASPASANAAQFAKVAGSKGIEDCVLLSVFPQAVAGLIQH
jgi:peptidoglycan hydrolase-like protein with peptidoglycan-binding domain